MVLLTEVTLKTLSQCDKKPGWKSLNSSSGHVHSSDRKLLFSHERDVTVTRIKNTP